MAITTRLQPKYTIRFFAITLVCLILGVWGIYDYAVRIPKRTRAYQRGKICLQVKQALEERTERDPSSETAKMIEEAFTKVHAEIQKLFALGLENLQEAPPDEQTTEMLASSLETSDQTWLLILSLFQGGLREAALRPSGSAPSQGYVLAVELAREAVNRTAEISEPGKWDRATQWMFILCLLCVPYFLWQYVRTKGRTYELADDGSIRGPEGEWSRDEIADIDMSRWMSKSVAAVVHTDGRTMKLDDYVHKNVDRIVGTMASERYPDAWQEDARPRKAETQAPEERVDEEPPPPAEG